MIELQSQIASGQLDCKNYRASLQMEADLEHSRPSLLVDTALQPSSVLVRQPADFTQGVQQCR
jgi:hypothetical protein